MARVRLADLNGPKWTSSGQNGPKWTILVHFGPVHFPTVPRPFPKRPRKIPGAKVGPDVMQSGSGVNFYFGPANFRKIAGEFLSKF